jgi:hypothetical protein
VAEHVADRVGRLRREDGDGGAAGHPDSELRDDEVGAVLGKDGDARAGPEALRLEMRRHPSRLVHDLGPGVIDDFPTADRLGQEDLVSMRCCLVLVDVIEHEHFPVH